MSDQPRAPRTAEGERIGPVADRPACGKCGAPLSLTNDCPRGCFPAREVRFDGEGTMHAPRNRRMP